jgi:hypothetical protein
MFAIADLALLALAEMKMFKALPAQRVYWILFIPFILGRLGGSANGVSDGIADDSTDCDADCLE